TLSAQEKKAEVEIKTDKNDQVRARPFGGKVKEMDAATKTITLEGKKSKRTFQVVSSTIIKKGGKPATLEDLKVGDEVNGYIREMADQTIQLVSLRIGPKTTPGQ
ncbi:MAG: hypothetical protein M3Y82_11500, partial [Verrucomicrobiota bacterium]|nr:hypothetical protein [Verrucomicrobiota bacterium]